mmetsp:Transcript_13038/g.52566  ORF Transcript_13038/g.52566 Transcript_13038/m.52566 type:complete len:303 (+) Transcript_13038:1662-2570(+)
MDGFDPRGERGEHGSLGDARPIRRAPRVDPRHEHVVGARVPLEPHAQPRHELPLDVVILIQLIITAVLVLVLVLVGTPRRKSKHHRVDAVGRSPRPEEIRGVSKETRDEEVDAHARAGAAHGEKGELREARGSVEHPPPGQARADAAEDHRYPAGSAEIRQQRTHGESRGAQYPARGAHGRERRHHRGRGETPGDEQHRPAHRRRRRHGQGARSRHVPKLREPPGVVRVAPARFGDGRRGGLGHRGRRRTLGTPRVGTPRVGTCRAGPAQGGLLGGGRLLGGELRRGDAPLPLPLREFLERS